MQPKRLLRGTALYEATGRSISQRYDDQAKREFPLGIKIGEKAVANLADDVVVWQEYRIARSQGFPGNFVDFINKLLKERPRRDDTETLQGILDRFDERDRNPLPEPEWRKKLKLRRQREKREREAAKPASSTNSAEVV